MLMLLSVKLLENKTTFDIYNLSKNSRRKINLNLNWLEYFLKFLLSIVSNCNLNIYNRLIYNYNFTRILIIFSIHII